MDYHNNVNETLKNIFSNAGLIDVICSLYEKHLTSLEIGELLNLDNVTIENHLILLLDMKLIKKKSYNKIDSYIVANSKVCDSILMLKDAIYRVSTSNNVTT